MKKEVIYKVGEVICACVPNQNGGETIPNSHGKSTPWDYTIDKVPTPEEDPAFYHLSMTNRNGTRKENILVYKKELDRYVKKAKLELEAVRKSLSRIPEEI